MEPQFEHDCDECELIGQLKEHDLYICPQGGWPTIVARYGNEGHEYLSGSSLRVAGMRLELPE